MPGTDKTRITVKCIRCGTAYSANRQHYNVSRRAGKPNFCPACVAQLRQGNGRKATETRIRNWVVMAREFVAPCRLRIVPEDEGPRARCNPVRSRRGGCPEYETCLDFAARNNWDGWRIA